MSGPIRRAWTVAEFLDWSGHADGRYEFDGVQPVAMTGGSNNHSLIIGNILFALRRRLVGSPCRVLGPDAGLQTIGDRIRYPDAMLTCSAFDGSARIVPGVSVVFEVLSPGSGRTDRITKVREYGAVPTILRYVMLEHAAMGLTVLSRTVGDGAWRADALTGGDTLALPEAGIEVPVAEFFIDTGLLG